MSLNTKTTPVGLQLPSTAEGCSRWNKRKRRRLSKLGTTDG
jgi:hypothetical protein